MANGIHHFQVRINRTIIQSFRQMVFEHKTKFLVLHHALQLCLYLPTESLIFYLRH